MADEFGRTTWDNFNMAIAMLVTSRSIDPRTKHGCYIIDKNNKPLSFGYNGPLRGSDDKKVSLQPPEKYFEMEHSERNAIFNYNGSLEGATAYITGFPCSDCFRALVQSGIKKIVYGPITSNMLETEEGRKELAAIQRMVDYCKGVELIEFQGDFWESFEIMKQYLTTKGIKQSKESYE